METIIVIGIIVGLVIFIFWSPPQTQSAASSKQPRPDTPIDLTNSRHVGMLVGMMGGSIQDAAIAKYALQRFEQKHGRKATFREAGLVIGIMRGMKS